MIDQELLQAMSQLLQKSEQRMGDMMDQKLAPINARLDGIDVRLDRLEENSEITRDGVNALISWAEKCSEALNFPLPRIAAE